MLILYIVLLKSPEFGHVTDRKHGGFGLRLTSSVEIILLSGFVFCAVNNKQAGSHKKPSNLQRLIHKPINHKLYSTH